MAITNIEKLVELDIRANMNLRIRLLEDKREEVQRIADNPPEAITTLIEGRSVGMPDTALRCVLLSWFLSTSWDMISPAEIGALTDAPILASGVTRNGKRELLSFRELYWYPDYVLRDPVQELLEDGYVDFTHVAQEGDE